MSLYVLVGPDGKPVEETVSTDADETWGVAYSILCGILGPEWRQRFWKRVGPSKISARRLGWRVRKCRIVLEEKP